MVVVMVAIQRLTIQDTNRFMIRTAAMVVEKIVRIFHRHHCAEGEQNAPCQQTICLLLFHLGSKGNQVVVTSVRLPLNSRLSSCNCSSGISSTWWHPMHS